MTPMNIELRSININARMSEETTCFSAKVFIDGKHVFDVSNHGHGGCDNWHTVPGGMTYREIDNLNGIVKMTYPTVNYGDFTSPADLESVVAELITESEVIKDIRRNGKKKILFLTGNMKVTEQMRQIPFKPSRTYPVMNDAWMTMGKEYIAKKHPGATILNDLTDDQITALVRKERVS